jgi:magnesium transporter
MNFKYMPELEWRYGYPAVLLLMLGLGLGMLYGFWRRGWL